MQRDIDPERIPVFVSDAPSLWTRLKETAVERPFRIPLLFVLAMVILVLWGKIGPAVPFKPDAWKNAVSGSNTRLCMYRDLARRHRLVGLTKDQIMTLLGWPDYEASAGGVLINYPGPLVIDVRAPQRSPSGNAFVYTLGTEWADQIYLEVVFVNGRVGYFRLRRG